MIKIRGIGKLIRFITKHFGGNKICAICHSKVAMWVPHPLILQQPILMKHLCIIGSDLKNHSCPICNSHDRERHLALYFKEIGFFEKNVKDKEILHFAAEKHITPLIIANNPKKYIKADFYPNAPDVEKIDMQAIPYPPQSFDLVIANHVLEHVLDDNLALSELYRVLRIGGFALLQTPFSAKLTMTLFDSGIDTDFLRTQLCGQADHVRLYGKNIFDRFAVCGFISRIVYHKEVLHNFDPKIYGINEDEPFMLFQRIQ